ARAAADVEVEVAGREALAHRVEREQRPHLVEAPHDPAAGEHERPPGRPLPPGAHDSPREISAAAAPSLNPRLWYNRAVMRTRLLGLALVAGVGFAARAAG